MIHVLAFLPHLIQSLVLVICFELPITQTVFDDFPGRFELSGVDCKCQFKGLETVCTCMSIAQVKGLVAQLIQVKDVSTATGLEVTAGPKVNTLVLRMGYH